MFINPVKQAGRAGNPNTTGGVLRRPIRGLAWHFHAAGKAGDFPREVDAAFGIILMEERIRKVQRPAPKDVTLDGSDLH
jgi:hypothetical protein